MARTSVFGILPHTRTSLHSENHPHRATIFLEFYLRANI